MKVKELKIEPVIGGAKITFLTDETEQLNKLISQSNKTPLNVKFEPVRHKRSLDANAYMWTLCDQIAEVVHATKEEIYKNAIREVGVYTDVAVQTIALNTLIDNWTSRGIGWLADIFDSKLDGCKRVRLYKGSHLYDTKQMSRLIDYIVEEAKELNIETITPAELARMVGKEEDGTSL